MGITGLWPLLEPSCQPVTLESLEGQRLAVDVSIWIYQAQLGYSSDAKCPQLQLLINRLSKLLFYKIRPVFVFDGPGVPSFKHRVLEERRLRKLADDLTMTEDKRRHLQRLAQGVSTEKELDGIKAGLVKSAKRPATDEELFNMPTTSTAPVVTLSDDEDADIIVEKDTRGRLPKSEDVEKLIEAREQIRLSRLNPESIPQDTEEFCKFQLQRLLYRNKLDRKIKQLSDRHVNSLTGKNVAYFAEDGRGMHMITRETDPDVHVVEADDASDGAFSRTWNEIDLTLDHMSYHKPSTSQDLPSIEDEAELDGRNFISKSSMIEDLWKRRIGNTNRATDTDVHQDQWSSDSGDGDFINVPDLLEMPYKGEIFAAPEDKTEEAVIEKEWDPQIGEDLLSEGSQNIAREAPTYNKVSSTYKELKEFLTACGFPWVESPGEAEAQCVELERLGLVQGVISDDSDVWAFGVQKVYRHLFSKTRQVQYYNLNKISQDTGLNQSDFVVIAMLSGGDYSAGLRGLGVVSVIEIISELSNSVATNEESIFSLLNTFVYWLFREKQFSTNTSILCKTRRIIEKQNKVDDLRGIANLEVVKAYLSPNVDSSTEEFRWRSVDIPRISSLVYQLVGWDDEIFKKHCMQPLEKWNDFITKRSSYQMHMPAFCHNIPQNVAEQKVSVTKRVAAALTKLQERRAAVLNEPSLICQSSFIDEGSVTITKICNKKSSAQQLKRKKHTARKATTRGKTVNVECRRPSTPLNLSESSEDD